MTRIEPDQLASRITDVVWRLRTITDRAATMPIDEGEWTPKQLLGHLIDSAVNTHQRLIRAQINDHLVDGVLRIDGYEQAQWVDANGWGEQPWEGLISLWEGFNQQILWTLRRFPERAWQVPVSLSGAPSLPLEDLLDYIEHLDHHVDNLRRVTLSLMPDVIHCPDGITLRMPTSADVDWLVVSCQDPQIPQWTGIPSPYTQATAHQFVQRAYNWATERVLARNYLIAEADGSPLGMVGLVRVHADDRAGEVGYWLAKSSRGRGLATIATRALTAEVLRAGYLRVTGEVIVGNPESQRVLERAGFTHEGILRSVGLQGSPPNVRRIDVHSYALIAGDPAADALLAQHGAQGTASTTGTSA